MREHVVGNFLSDAWSNQNSTNETVMDLVASSVNLIENRAMATMVLGSVHSKT